MRRFIAWQRNRDFLRELRYVVWVGLVFMLLILISETVGLLTGEPIVTRLPVTAYDLPPLGLSRPGVAVDLPTEVTVTIDHPTGRQRMLYALAQAPSALLYVAVLALLAWVVHHALKIGPFTKRTVNVLRWMGIALFAGILAGPVEGWALMALSETVLADRWSLSVDVPLAWVFGGLLCFAAAEVVQRGVLMREELATVV